MNFNYLARDRSGRVTRGALQADSPLGLKSLLQSMDLQLISLEALPEAGAAMLGELDPRRWMPIRSRDVEFALRQLAIMLRSGLNLLSALKSLVDQTELVRLKRVLESLHHRVAKGDTLATAMAEHNIFPALVTQLTSVGEETGKLDQVLEQASSYMTQRRMAISEVRVALAYPTVVATAAILIAAYLIFAVIPELQKFLSAMGRKLPRMTQSLVDLAQWFHLHGAMLGVIGLAVLVGLIAVAKWPPGRLWFDRWILQVPIIGGIFQLSGTATLANSLAVMIRSGIKLVEALNIAQRLQGNQYLAAKLSEASHSVVRGKAIAPSLAGRDGFAPMLSSMISIAERTGQLDATLEEVAKFCDVELKSKIKRMSQLVEPAVIVVAGGIVGYVYIAFFMALMSAGGNFK